MKNDVSILSELHCQLAEIAALPAHDQRRELWRRVNDLETARPLAWIDEIP